MVKAPSRHGQGTVKARSRHGLGVVKAPSRRHQGTVEAKSRHRMHSMALTVMEFQHQGYKIKVFKADYFDFSWKNLKN